MTVNSESLSGRKGSGTAGQSGNEQDVGERRAAAHGLGLHVEAERLERASPLCHAATVEPHRTVSAREGDRPVDPVADPEAKSARCVCDAQQQDTAGGE